MILSGIIIFLLIIIIWLLHSAISTFKDVLVTLLEFSDRIDIISNNVAILDGAIYTYNDKILELITKLENKQVKK